MTRHSFKKVLDESKIWGDAFFYQFDEKEQYINEEVPITLDKICRIENLQELGDNWNTIHTEEAMELLKNALRFDLVYTSIERMSEKMVEELIFKLLGNFNVGNSQAYTNCVIDPWNKNGNEFSWNPLTQQTFDIGLVFINDNKLYFVYVMSED